MPHGAVRFPFGDCRVCADKATGVHYGVATCEGCKGFFKRSIPKADRYKCFFGGQCSLNPQNRNRCKSCRFQRCLQAGMSTEAVKMGRIPKVEKERALQQEKDKEEMMETDDSSKLQHNDQRPHVAGEPEVRTNSGTSGPRPDAKRPGPSAQPSDILRPGPPGQTSDILRPGPPGQTSDILRPGPPGQTSDILPPGPPGPQCDISRSGPSWVDGLQGPTPQAPWESRPNNDVNPRLNNGSFLTQTSSTKAATDYYEPQTGKPAGEGNHDEFDIAGKPCMVSLTTHLTSLLQKVDPKLDTGSIVIELLMAILDSEQGFRQHDELKDRISKILQQNGQSRDPALGSNGNGTFPPPSEPSCPQEVLDILCKLLPTATSMSTLLPKRDQSSDAIPASDHLGPLARGQPNTSGGPHTNHHDTVLTNNGAIRPALVDNILSDWRATTPPLYTETPGEYLTRDPPPGPSAGHGLNNIVHHDHGRNGQSHNHSLDRSQEPRFNHNHNHSVDHNNIVHHDHSRNGQSHDNHSLDRSHGPRFNHNHTLNHSNSHDLVTLPDHLTAQPPTTSYMPNESYTQPPHVSDSQSGFPKAQSESWRTAEEPGAEESKTMTFKSEEAMGMTGDNVDHKVSIDMTELTEKMRYMASVTLKRVRRAERLMQYNLDGKLETPTVVLRVTPDASPGISQVHPINKLKIATREQVQFMWDQLMASIPDNSAMTMELCSSFPMFDKLSAEDQKILAREAYFDIWIITHAKLFHDGDTYLRLKCNGIYNRWWMNHILPDSLIAKMYTFTESLTSCQLTDIEMLIVCAIQLINPDREGLENVKFIKEINNCYLDILAYMIEENHRTNHGRILIKIFRLLPSLTPINQEQSEVIGNFSIDKFPETLAYTEHATDDKSWKIDLEIPPELDTDDVIDHPSR